VSSPENATRRRDVGRVVGLAVVAAIVAFVAVWMIVKGRATVAAPPSWTAPAIAPVADTRFNESMWFLPNDAALGFVEIPAGVFTMGSDPAADRVAYDNERWSQSEPQGKVELPTFYIERYEVTVAQFGAFVTATRRVVDPQALRAPAAHPVTRVTWTDALAYAHWLEAQLRESAQTPAQLAALLKDGWRLSLPNEAQWEKAARGTDGRIFPWGNDPAPDKANFGRSGTLPVGSIACAECSYGLSDMSGNVWELTRSPFQPYPYAADGAPHDPQAEALFVMRGGAFGDPANNVRAATRGGIDPGVRNPTIGFRLVLEK
jgi:formylglycine-generating enzyme required for sulfatase activity